jgi:glycosyltransferase involved in cell wall biosynthesis
MLAQFYSPIVGGEERHVQDLSVELVKRGHEITVATILTPGTAEFEVDQGVRIYRVKSTMQRSRQLYIQADRSHAPPFPDPEITLALRRIIAKEKPQIVHAHNWLYHSFLPLKAWSRVPLVLSVHDYSLACVQKRMMHFGVACSGPGLSKCLHCASNHYGSLKGTVTTLTHRLSSPAVRAAVDIFLPVSMATAIGNGLVEKNLPFEVIPNFLPDEIDLSSGDIESYVSQLPEDGYLLFVGDLSLDKGVGVLLRAYADLQSPPPLILIGRKNRDTPTDLPDNVRLMNSWPHPAVMNAWHRSSVALVPSLTPETFGIVAIEAMAMGRPVIASRIGGLADVVQDGETGFLIPPGDANALTQAIQRLLDNPTLRKQMGQNAMDRSQNFRASRVIPRIEAIYNKLTHRAVETQVIDEHRYNEEVVKGMD